LFDLFVRILTEHVKRARQSKLLKPNHPKLVINEAKGERHNSQGFTAWSQMIGKKT